MVNKINSSPILFLLGVFILNVLVPSVSATDCWQYTSNTTGQCTSANGCNWRSDSWGSWCEQLSCWSLSSQNSCTSTSITGKNCTWNGGGVTYSCDEISCWSFSGTNNNSCVLNSAGKSCSWSNSCYTAGAAPPGVYCWNISSQSTCSNTTGCAWGQCQDAGCWSYSTNNTCTAGKDWRGSNCTWSSSGNYCTERNCWNFYNQSDCESATGINCEWKWNACQEKSCSSFDYTNEATCVNNTIGKACSWSNGYCSIAGCWSATSNSSCSARQGCQWQGWTSSGWCSEVNCWTWDSMNGGNQTKCENLDSDYKLNCRWTGNPPGNLTTGWCSQDVSSSSCSNLTTEKSCYDTNYCWWQANDWNNPSAGGNCTNPNWGGGGYSNKSITNDWNPGCYIFDVNSTSCNSILGCNYSNGFCVVASSGPYLNYSTNISNNGISCSYINDSTLCNNMASLSTCCSWQNGTCADNRVSTSCWKQQKQTPNGETACEDAETNSDCLTIAGDPWYMPCKWDNSTDKCKFKASNVFGNGTQSLIKIENQQICEVAGGKWITENYCEGNVSIPSGRCEYKFDEEANCDKACYACERYDSDGNPINASNAQSACTGSKLGFCEFTASTSAPNGIGFCKAKEQFKKGIAGDCDSNCGDCAFLGNPQSNSTRDSANNCLTPSCFCIDSKANLAGGGCKWISDNTTVLGGICAQKGEKVCEDSCDRCDTQKSCSNNGRINVANQSGSCKWQGSENDGNCVANIAGDVEICWNGVDDDNDDLIDCADASCYSDSFCGLVSGTCSGWTTNSTCTSNGCEWVSDKWGSWCDFKGSQCWKYDSSEPQCNGAITANEALNITPARLPNNYVNESITFRLTNLGTGWVVGSVNMTNASGTSLATNFTVNYASQTINFSNSTFMISGGGFGNITNVTYQYFAITGEFCKWNNGTGSGSCERDWSIAEQCMGLNRTSCNSTPCVWTNDTWCNAQGSGTDWCNNYGGWCNHQDFVPKNCWQKSDNSSCSIISGCSWKVDQWSSPHCEVNWSGNCGGYATNNACSNAGCLWRTDSWGSWCDNSLSICWSYNAENACNAVSGGKCTWRTYGAGSGTCEPSCYSLTSSNSCTDISGCIWKAENGWCEEQQSNTCYNSSNNNNQANCQATSGCKWNNPGWCSPKDGFSSASSASGGGAAGAVGGDCFKYDGNQSLCTNKSAINVSCGWIVNQNPSCEPNWGVNCWQYNSVDAGCNAANGCWFKNDSFGSWCGNLVDQCWNNATLANNATSCNANPYCVSTDYGCSSRCSNLTTSSACTEVANNACRFVSGWCNPAGMNQIFDNMEGGAPVPLSVDVCDGSETSQASVDICGLGMKDMGDSYGFGVNVRSFVNSSVCNKEKVGFPIPGAIQPEGTGNETVKFTVYLDADGSTSGGCSLDSNSSAAGYEFKLRYSSEWSASTSKASETSTSYKCDNSQWKVSDLKISVWKKIMCSDIGGPMIAVEKAELARFPTLYNSTADMRVYASTIGNTGNLTNPSDIIGPGWTTPGATDFEIFDAFSYGADTAKFEDILKNGYVQGEDCFTPADDDNDGKVNCFDYDCQFEASCSSSGVNAASYIDKSTPLVTGVKIEEYPDGALVMYDSNKPTNGTLEFYKNDSQCSSLNSTVYDMGITSASVRNYKEWHKADIYSSAIGYALDNSTAYYYKLKVCDNSGKCAISKCSSFITATSSSKCGFCNFVTRIKMPSDWNVSYDVNQDGIYEHTQGQVCGPTAGMKSNYTMRQVNIKLSKSDGSTYFEFINASLSKTGLNDKVRSVSDSGSFIGTSTLVGLTSETRDKIVNNLHPELCRVKIPHSGTCTQLFHCDDNGNNCVDRTSVATLIDSTNCVWQVPNCEFSTYKTNAVSGSSGSSSSGGGGGGGGFGPSTNNTSTTAESSKGSPAGQVQTTPDKINTSKAPGEDKISNSEQEAPPAVSKEERSKITFLIWVGAVGLIILFAIIYINIRKK